VAAVLTAVGLTGPVAAQSLSAPELKAAYLFNFAQFVEWPAEVSAGAPLAMCIVNDGAGNAVPGAVVTLTSGNTPVQRNTSGATITNMSMRLCDNQWVGRNSSRCMKLSPGPNGPCDRYRIWIAPRAQRWRCTKNASSDSGANPKARCSPR